MRQGNKCWPVVGVLSLLFLAALVSAQDGRWEETMAAGMQAFDKGRYAEAEKQFVSALDEAEKFGEQDPRLGLSHLSLGKVYQEQDKYAEAEPCYQRALAIFEESQGSEHPNMALSLSSLASLYSTQGRYAEAEPLYQRLVEIRETTLGTNHPKVAQGLEDYAALLRKMGQDAGAEKMKTRAEAIRTKARIASNESATAWALRDIYVATLTYQLAYGSFPPSLAVLGPSVASDKPSCKAADLLSSSLASGRKSDYLLEYRAGPPVESPTPGCPAGGQRFVVTARPLKYNKTGKMSFFMDESGVIRATLADRSATPGDRPLRLVPRK